MPWDLRDFRYDRDTNSSLVKGVLYRGDAKTKYSLPNRPGDDEWVNVNPEEKAVLTRLNNEKEASQFMVQAVDFDPATPTAMPDVPSVADL